ncbi:hypothetical protein F5B20DRAFT_208879 [Whalleya microplaca]|nr:hypothetical protein F5B20DRAFT_208879 [Whalleya microplaca]
MEKSEHSLPTSLPALSERLKKWDLSTTTVNPKSIKNSASKLREEEYLVLRAVCTQYKASDLQDAFASNSPPRWLNRKYLDSIGDDLGVEFYGSSWMDYLQEVSPVYEGVVYRLPNLNNFGLIIYQQRACQNAVQEREIIINEAQDQEDASEAKARNAFVEEFSGMDINFWVHSNKEDSNKKTAKILPTKDEQIVNSALILFLQAVTAFNANVKGHWSIERKAFHARTKDGEKIYRADTDGILELYSGHISALVEVKRSDRVGVSVAKEIKMQEVAEIAAWISEDPPTMSRGRDEEFYRFHISQHRHSIYITIGSFNEHYVDYLQNGNLSNNPVLTIREYGPFSIDIREHVEFVGKLVLAFSIQESSET